MKLEYHPKVKIELEAARNFYERKIPGLGAKFIDEFERQALQIVGIPERWMVVKNDIRRALMSRFPYAIYFRYIAPDLIRIIVLKHQRRHPAYGKTRI